MDRTVVTPPIRNGGQHEREPQTPEQRAAVAAHLALMDQLIEEIDAATDGDMDAVAAIREQRRDL